MQLSITIGPEARAKRAHLEEQPLPAFGPAWAYWRLGDDE